MYGDISLHILTDLVEKGYLEKKGSTQINS